VQGSDDVRLVPDLCGLTFASKAAELKEKAAPKVAELKEKGKVKAGEAQEALERAADKANVAITTAGMQAQAALEKAHAAGKAKIQAKSQGGNETSVARARKAQVGLDMIFAASVQITDGAVTAANVTVPGTLNAASKAVGALATAGDSKGETHGERALREHLAEQAEQGAAASEASEEDLPVYIMVTVPEGVTPGTPVGIKSPSGESLEVDVPEGYTAGEAFPVVIQMVESHYQEKEVLSVKSSEYGGVRM